MFPSNSESILRWCASIEYNYYVQHTSHLRVTDCTGPIRKIACSVIIHYSWNPLRSIDPRFDCNRARERGLLFFLVFFLDSFLQTSACLVSRVRSWSVMSLATHRMIHDGFDEIDNDFITASCTRELLPRLCMYIYMRPGEKAFSASCSMRACLSSDELYKVFFLCW